MGFFLRGLAWKIVPRYKKSLVTSRDREVLLPPCNREEKVAYLKRFRLTLRPTHAIFHVSSWCPPGVVEVTLATENDLFQKPSGELLNCPPELLKTAASHTQAAVVDDRSYPISSSIVETKYRHLTHILMPVLLPFSHNSRMSIVFTISSGLFKWPILRPLL